MENKDMKKRQDEEKLLTFLQKTKDGEYAKIDQTSLPYVRIREERSCVETVNESFYYSIS